MKTDIENIQKAKDNVAKEFRKNWAQIKNDYEYGMGVSKMISFEDLMDRVCIEYAKISAPAEDLILLASRINSADDTGHEYVIKDLRNQLVKILKHFGLRYKWKFRKL